MYLCCKAIKMRDRTKPYTEKDFREARMVSIQAHGNQTYDGIFPYHKHLDDVVDVLKRFGFSGKYIIAASYICFQVI